MGRPSPSTKGPQTEQISRAHLARSLGLDPYPGRSQVKTSVAEILARAKEEDYWPVWAAGRISEIDRDNDRLSLRLTDSTGSLTFHLKFDRLSGECQKVTKVLAAGDIVEARVEQVEGQWAAESVRLLAPSLLLAADDATCLPDPEVLHLRARILKALRGFFDDRGYLEVETPALVRAPDPAPHLDSFLTEYNDARGRRRLYLQTSPELSMKRLLGAGHERIYQIAKFFRNGEITDLHNPEFTGLEWYEAYADYRSAMETAEALIDNVAKEVLGTETIQNRGRLLDLRPPWERISVREAFSRHAGIDLWSCLDRKSLAKAAAGIGIHVTEQNTWEDLFFKISLERVEPHLGLTRPTLLFDYPARLALLSKRKADEPTVAERFEIFAGGMELANGFTELNDPEEQRDRWEEELKPRRREKPGEAPAPLDEAFLAALAAGVPPATGVALGLDRLIMLLADRETIGEVRCFPLDLDG